MIKSWMFKPQESGGLPLEDWTYRKSITLSRASGAVSNYQMKLLVGESSGATGEDVDCGGHCASDFDDLRFTTSDGETLLDYWIESISGSTPNQLATVWIEFDSIGTGATTFYMYYGNVGAAAASNGVNTFPFFDHFDGDLSKWSGDTESASNSSSICTLTGDSSGKKINTTTFAGDLAMRCRASLYNANDASDLFLANSTSFTSYIGITHNGALTNHSQHFTSANVFSNTNAGFDGYHIYDIRRVLTDTDTASTLVDNAGAVSTTTNVPPADVMVILRSKGTGVYELVDWVLIRNYTTTEPAWGAWGAEES